MAMLVVHIHDHDYHSGRGGDDDGDGGGGDNHGGDCRKCHDNDNAGCDGGGDHDGWDGDDGDGACYRIQKKYGIIHSAFFSFSVRGRRRLQLLTPLPLG